MTSIRPSRFYVTSSVVYNGNYFLSFSYPHGPGRLPLRLPPFRLDFFLPPRRRGRLPFFFFLLGRGDRGRLSRGCGSLSVPPHRGSSRPGKYYFHQWLLKQFKVWVRNTK